MQHRLHFLRDLSWAKTIFTG
uniref:DUF1891 domain-containing protein n=1 Tax=Desulfurella acetivorans TaxID=33002 RepID=A0A832EXI7_DESAE